MSDQRRQGAVSRYLNGGRSKLLTQPRDYDDMHVNGSWTPEQLTRMDAKFTAAMERAIARGLERRPKGERARAA
jgi:hypothetical protein